MVMPAFFDSAIRVSLISQTPPRDTQLLPSIIHQLPASCPTSCVHQQRSAAPRQALDRLPKVLEQATKARSLGIRLKSIEFADDLSARLLKHAAAMEKLYMEFQEKTNLEADGEKDYVALNAEWNSKGAWFQKAQAG